MCILASGVEAVLLIGIPGAGKSTFFRERFFDSHVRISLDVLRTRERERLLLNACLSSKQPFVVDNTNIRAEDRAPYIAAARAAGFRVSAYFFDTPVRTALGRNRSRPKPVPVPGILRASKRLEPPAPAEAFDALFRVRPAPANQFDVTPFEVSPPLPLVD